MHIKIQPYEKNTYNKLGGCMKRHRRRFRRMKRYRSALEKKITFFIICTLLITAIFALLIDVKAADVLYTMAVDKAKNVAIQAINDSVSAVIDSDDESYKEFVDYRYDKEGNIISVGTNTNLTNAIEGAILDEVVKRIDNQSRCPVKVPIGTLTGSDLLTGRGPSLTFYISLSGNARSGIENLFESTGINQSRHQIQIRIEADISIITSGKKLSTSVENTIVIGETIIVGKIPESYVRQPG